jgi:hypothetical protein
LLPPEYPFKSPHIVFLTPSGRFETGTKVCLSFSAYHLELWLPAWGIQLILEALISFLPTLANEAIGALTGHQSNERSWHKRVSHTSVLDVEMRLPCCWSQRVEIPNLGSPRRLSSSVSCRSPTIGRKRMRRRMTMRRLRW